MFGPPTCGAYQVGRTGYVGPMFRLDLDALPGRIKQMIHEDMKAGDPMLVKLKQAIRPMLLFVDCWAKLCRIDPLAAALLILRIDN